MFIFFEIDMPPRTRGGYTSSAPRRQPTGSERRRRVQLREVELAADQVKSSIYHMIFNDGRPFALTFSSGGNIDVVAGQANSLNFLFNAILPASSQYLFLQSYNKQPLQNDQLVFLHR